MALSKDDNPHVAKILNVCELLDEDYRARPADNKRITATMFYLASQRIKKAFGKKTKPEREGQEAVYALSGFKKPLNALIEEYTTSTNPEYAEQIRLTLIYLSHYFDDHFFEITHHPVLENEALDLDAKLRGFISE